MARAKPVLFSAVSGVAGGVEFAMAKEGMVLKRRKPPRPWDSPAQIAAMTLFYKRVADWQAMTPEAMLEWTAYANTHPAKNRLGKVIYLTGYQLFMKLRGTEDGILLPFGAAPAPTFGTLTCYVGGPYNIEIVWPPEAEDDWCVWLMLGCSYWDITKPPNYVWRSAGSYLKASCPSNFYDAFTALGFAFTLNQSIGIAANITAPRYFPGPAYVSGFQVIELPQWAWHLTMDDDAPDTNVVDAYGHYNQVFEGTNPNTEDHHVAGVHNGALHFDGSTSRINLSEASYHDYMDTGQPFTLCIWWKPDTPIGNTYKDFLSSYALTTPSIRFAIKNSESQIFVTWLYGGTRYYTSVSWAETDTNEWRHFALVRNGTNVRMFKDGVKNYDASNAGFQGRPWVTGTPLSIGCQRGVTYFANGAADDVYLFNEALSDAEVAALAVP